MIVGTQKRVKATVVQSTGQSSQTETPTAARGVPRAPSRILERFWSFRTAWTAALAALVGGLTGLGAVAFIEAIAYCQRFFFNGG